MENIELTPRVAAIGVGGAGCKIVSKIYRVLPSVDSIAINCDKEAMHACDADKKLYICKSVTNGEGAKGDVGIGRECAMAHIDDIEKAVMGYDAVFIIAGMGGGTGTGAVPIIAEKTRSMGIMTFVVATMPFSFESARLTAAKEGVAKIRQVCPGTVVVENDMVVREMPDATMSMALDAVNRSVVSYVEKKTLFIKECFESEFDSIAEEMLDSRVDGVCVDLTESIDFRPKTAKE